MEYARIEMLLIRGGWSHAIRVAGAGAGRVLGAVIDPSHLGVAQTLVPRKSARHLSSMEAAKAEPASAPLPEGTQVLSAATRVYGPDGPLGIVSRVWVARASSQVSHLLVRASAGLRLHRDEYVLPAALIASVGNDRVTLKAGPKAVVDLPLYRPDAAIAADVRRALDRVLADPRARRGVKLLVDDGHLTIAGEVDTVDQVRLAESAAAAVAGARGITVDLIAQEALAAAVEERIAPLVAVASNGHGAVRVLTEHGIVFLEGSVTTEQARGKIEREALSAAGARVVVNNLQVDGQPPIRGEGTVPLVRNR